jgi:RNA recognition motif-containing protein
MTTKPEAAGDFRIAPFEAWATMWRRFGVKVEKPGKRGTRIHVKNLTDSSTGEQLKTLFASFGEILEADVKKDDDGKCRGFGYVILATEEAAVKAVAEMNGKKVDDKELNVILVERKPPKGKGKGDDAKGKGNARNTHYYHVRPRKGRKGKGKEQDSLIPRRASVPRRTYPPSSAQGQLCRARRSRSTGVPRRRHGVPGS